VVVDDEHDVKVRYVAGIQLDGHPRPRGMLANVGQGLLDDAQNGLADRPGEMARIAVDRQLGAPVCHPILLYERFDRGLG
jgi:hypothetical protein